MATSEAMKYTYKSALKIRSASLIVSNYVVKVKVIFLILYNVVNPIPSFQNLYIITVNSVAADMPK